MEKHQKKQIKKYISWGLAVVLVALLAVMPLLAGNSKVADGPQASILSATVQRADISTRLIGGGTLTNQAAVELTIPAAVKLTGYLVENGDTVEKGDVIATVDRVTVMTAITQVQETLDYLAEEIEAVSDEKAAEKVTAQAGGRLKIIYAKEGEAVQDVMLRDGALAVLSLDGLMAVQVECTTALSGGDEVRLNLSDGTVVTGKVESNLKGILTVITSDEGYAVGEEVTITTIDGTEIGSGALYIHSRWNATAYSGTVKDIHVSEGDTVNSGKTLMSLENTGHTASYQQLVNQHREYEALMLELFKMYQSESLLAPCAGVVSGVDADGTFMLADTDTGWTVTFLANAPNGDDESTYANYVGRVEAVSEEGLLLKMNPQELTITDYKDLSAIPLDTALMTEEVTYAGQVPIYELMDGEWAQLEGAGISVGDVLLFAGDGAGNFVWIVRVERGGEESQPTEPSEPGQTEQPTVPGQSGSGFPQWGGYYPGFGGMVQTEPEFELYALDTVTVASVTAQERMTVEITIDELDISKISAGQTAAVTIDALGGEVVTATVTKIANNGENLGGNSKFTVELTLEKSGDMLPGMYASVVLTLGITDNAVSVPVAALVENGTETVLYTSYDEETGELGTPVAVTVGVSDGENAQILSGITEGETCYYAYYDTLPVSNIPDMGGFSFY